MKQPTICELAHCPRLIEEQPGHKPRLYCCNAHRLQAHRLKQMAEQRNALRQQWARLPQVTQGKLEAILESYDVEAAQLAFDGIKTCLSDLATAIQVAQIFQLELEQS